MVQPALGTALVSGVSCTPCPQMSLSAALAAVGLAPEILHTHEEPVATDPAEKLVQIDLRLVHPGERSEPELDR
jgi:hypothetical protein